MLASLYQHVGRIAAYQILREIPDERNLSLLGFLCSGLSFCHWVRNYRVEGKEVQPQTNDYSHTGHKSNCLDHQEVKSFESQALRDDSFALAISLGLKPLTSIRHLSLVTAFVIRWQGWSSIVSAVSAARRSLSRALASQMSGRAAASGVSLAGRGRARRWWR